MPPVCCGFLGFTSLLLDSPLRNDNGRAAGEYRKFKSKRVKCKSVEALRDNSQFHSGVRLCHTCFFYVDLAVGLGIIFAKISIIRITSAQG
jgi:hypothetical protein